MIFLYFFLSFPFILLTDIFRFFKWHHDLTGSKEETKTWVWCCSWSGTWCQSLFTLLGFFASPILLELPLYAKLYWRYTHLFYLSNAFRELLQHERSSIFVRFLSSCLYWSSLDLIPVLLPFLLGTMEFGLSLWILTACLRGTSNCRIACIWWLSVWFPNLKAWGWVVLHLGRHSRS